MGSSDSKCLGSLDAFGDCIDDVVDDGGEIIDDGGEIIDDLIDDGEDLIDDGKDLIDDAGEGVVNAGNWLGGVIINGVNYIGDVDDGLLSDLRSGAHLTGDFVVDDAMDVGNLFDYFGSISQQGVARRETVDRGPTGIVDESACNEMDYFEWNRDIGLCQVKNNEDLNSEDLFRECANVAGNVVFEGFDGDTIDQPQTSGSMFDVVGTFVDQGLKQIPELPMTNVEELQGLNTTATDALEGVFESMTETLSWQENMNDESWLAAYENMNREEAQAYANSLTKFDYKGKYRVKPEVGFPVITNTRMADTTTNFVDAFRMCSRRCTRNIYPQPGGGLTTPHVDPEHYCRGFSIIYKPNTKTYTCEQYKTHDNRDTKWRAGNCADENANIAGECGKLSSVESNPEDDKLGNNSGLYWRVGGLDIEGATLNADTVGIPPLSLAGMPKPPPGADMDQHIEDYLAGTLPPPPPWKWKQELKTDVWYTRDVFHFHEGTNPKGSLKNCLEECNKRGDCEGIVTDISHNKCWGKEELTTKLRFSDRILYKKSYSGLLSPWGGGVEWDIHPWNPDPREPSGLPPPDLNVSTNGRCGPFHGDKRCPGKQCCSPHGWCGGSQGTFSSWCFNRDGNIGRDNGKYDGKAPPPPPMSTEFTRLGKFRLLPGKSGYPYSQFFVDNPANAVEECETACKDNSNCPGFSLDWHQGVDKVNCMVFKSNTGEAKDQSCVNEPFGAHCRAGVTGKPGVTEGGMWWRGTRTSQ